MKHRCIAGLLLVGFALTVGGRTQSAPFVIQGVTNLPAVTPGVQYRYPFITLGGTAPVVWSVTQGKLPPGLTLQKDTGLLAGVSGTDAPARFQFEITATDARGKTTHRTFALALGTTLELRWVAEPALTGAVLAGATEVDNLTPHAVDLTFIAVAVNEYNKAFTLGYQHFTLPGATTPLKPARQQIPFHANLPPGNYLVHVDAVGEYAAGPAIYRTLLETPRKFVVPPGIPSGIPGAGQVLR